jgi:hypothetical protein
MQSINFRNLKPGITYRIHNNAQPNGSKDTLGTYLKTVVFSDGDIRVHFDNIIVADYRVPTQADGYHPHVRQPPHLIRSIDPETHTFYITAENMAVRRTISGQTGRLVRDPSITNYFGGKRKRKTRRKRCR